MFVVLSCDEKIARNAVFKKMLLSIVGACELAEGSGRAMCLRERNIRST